MKNKHHKFNTILEKEVSKGLMGSFLADIFYPVIGYVIMTFWLNAVRADWPIAIVWIMIAIQFLLYFLIFVNCYKHSFGFGSGWLGSVIFIALAVLGRVENWELFIIPFTIIATIIFLTVKKDKLAKQEWKAIKEKTRNEQKNKIKI